jgi:hypothetical protein
MKKGSFLPAGVVCKNVDPTLLGEDGLDNALPIVFPCHVQMHALNAGAEDLPGLDVIKCDDLSAFLREHVDRCEPIP